MGPEQRTCVVEKDYISFFSIVCLCIGDASVSSGTHEEEMNFNESLRGLSKLNPEEKAETFKLIAAETFKDAKLRSELGADLDTWPTLLLQLEVVPNEPGSGELALKRLLQLCSNLSATSFSGPTTLLCDVCNGILQLQLDEPALQKIQWQVLSNLAVGFQHLKGSNLHSMIPYLRSIDTRVLIESPLTAFPFLTFTSRLTNASPEGLTAFLSESRAFENFLIHYPEWILGDSQYDNIVYSGTNLVTVLISRGLFGFLLDSIEHDLSHKATLFKIVNSILESPSLSSEILNDTFWKTSDGEHFQNSLIAECKRAATEIIPFIPTQSRKKPEALLLWNLACSLLEIMGSVLALFSETKLTLARSELLYHLIALLRATEALPKASKLKDMSPDYELSLTDFPYLVSFLIPVITHLVKDDKSAQSEMRTSGGLTSILNCCIIDANNPFMKERALLCIKYLLENNEENQKVVAMMEARRDVDPDVLQKAGFEAEFRNGKLRVKSDKPDGVSY